MFLLHLGLISRQNKFISSFHLPAHFKSSTTIIMQDLRYSKSLAWPDSVQIQMPNRYTDMLEGLNWMLRLFYLKVSLGVSSPIRKRVGPLYGLKTSTTISERIHSQ